MASPQKVLIVGCGLIGTSMALAIRRVHPDTLVDGVETSRRHQQDAVSTRAFQHVYSSLPGPDMQYDLAILAIPVDNACLILGEVVLRATVVMDVCSVKKPICDRAQELSLDKVFAPTHPMAGNTGQGPTAAVDDLFVGQPWILLREYEQCSRLADWLGTLGARVEWVDDALEHDTAMAAVSHGIHLMSVTAMLASYSLQTSMNGSGWPRITGPGFRDITRLSQSPHEFWVQTLLQNRQAVCAYLTEAEETIQKMRAAIESGDIVGLSSVLQQAKARKDDWTQGV